MISAHSNQPGCLRQWLVLVIFHALGVFAQPAEPANRRVLDRAVASVEGRVITLTQLEFEARVILINAGGLEAAFAPLDQETLTKSLNTMLDQRLATLEADKLDAYSLEPGELERALASFRARFSSEARFRQFLERYEVELGDVAEVLKRSLRAQRALDARLRLKAQVSEVETRQYRAQHPELKDVAPELVRQRLYAQRFQALVREELAQARRQVDVRLLGPFEPKPENTP
jgi:hypothetical protein